MARLRTLGGISLDLTSVNTLSSPRKELTLLAYLAAKEGRPVRRTALASLFWEDREETRARQSLRQGLLELKRLLGDGLVVTEDQVTLAPGAIEVDTLVFERGMSSGRYEEAVAAWGGEFLPEAESAAGEELRAWIDAERQRLHRLLAAAFQALVSVAETEGRTSDAYNWAQRWAELQPLQSAAHIRLIRLLRRMGNDSDALVRYATATSQLAGIEHPAELTELGQVLQKSLTVPRPTSSGAAALLTPDMIGRDQPLQTLLRAWKAVRSGAAEAVVVEGVAGIGKTRLCQEFIRRLENDPVVLRFRASLHAIPETMEALRALLAGLVNAPGLIGARPEALRTLGTIVPELRGQFPNEPEKGGLLDLTDACLEALAAVAEEGPVVVWIEDLGSADKQSREVIGGIAERLPSGVLFLVCGRNDDPDSLAALVAIKSRREMSRLVLPPLTADEVELVLATMLPLEPGQGRQLAVRLHSEVGGNPLHIIELTAALIEHGTLARTEQATWHLALGPDTPLPLPTGLHDVLQRRVGHLTALARKYADAAARAGRSFEHKEVRDAALLSPGEAEAALEGLLSARIVRPLSGAGRSFEFTHDLVWRVLCDLAAVGTPRREAEARTRRRKKSVYLAAAAVVLVVATAAIVSLLPARRAARPGTGAARYQIAVLPFAVGGGEDVALLRDGMPELLGRAVDALPDYRSIDTYTLLRFMGSDTAHTFDPQRGQSVAAHFGASHFVIGNVTKIGARLRVHAALYPSGAPRPLVAETVEGEHDSLLNLVDQLTARLLGPRTLGKSLPTIGVAAQTTSSLPALRAFLEGEREYRGGRFYEAAELFRKATQEDTLFALAYLRLALAAEGTPEFHGMMEAATMKALALGDRLSQADHFLAQGFLANMRGHLGDAENILTSLLYNHPEYIEGWIQLGGIHTANYVLGRPNQEATADFDRALALDPDYGRALEWAMDMAQLRRDYRAADSIIRRWQAATLRTSKDPSDTALGPILLAIQTFGAGDRTAQMQMFDQLRSLDGFTLRVLYDRVRVYTDNHDAAQRIVRWIADSVSDQRSRGGGVRRLGMITAFAGQFRAARAGLTCENVFDRYNNCVELEALLTLLPSAPFGPEARDSIRRRLAADTSKAPEWQPTTPMELSSGWLAVDSARRATRPYLLGMLSLRLGDTASAARYEKEVLLVKSPRWVDSLAEDLALGLRAERARLEGRYQEALSLFAQVQVRYDWNPVWASVFFAHDYDRYARAEMLYALGRLEEAYRWFAAHGAAYERGRMWEPHSHYRRGQIAQRLGWRDKAVSHYSTFIELWKNADPELQPLVNEARNQLAVLTARH